MSTSKQARILQSINDFFAVECSRQKPQPCSRCGCLMQLFEGHFWLYGTEMSLSADIRAIEGESSFRFALEPRVLCYSYPHMRGSGVSVVASPLSSRAALLTLSAH